MAELKPCPFCGGEGMIGAKYRYHYPKLFIAVCRKCEAMAHYGKTMEEAAEKWNSRNEPTINNKSKWIDRGGVYECERCGGESGIMSNFCPDCGAEMNGE